ncbi:hypothetical protein [Dactylosporangium sp. CA-233914]|uniref:hypothetical protein n=1 Tax=Dactylosporangium sp. CA-233914 TaxID=3239934 RepID=UPI003D920051
MHALFRLTGKPVVDLLLVFFWWPIALMIWAVGALIMLLEPAIERQRATYHRPIVPPDVRRMPAGEAHRRAAMDIATGRMFAAEGVIMPDRLDSLADLRTAVDRAQTLGELAHLVGVPVEALGPLPKPARSRHHTVLIVAGVTLAFSCVACCGVALVTAPPQPKSWTEWCGQYHNADGSLKVGPSDIGQAVHAAERLPVPADPTAAYELNAAITAAAVPNSGSQRLAAAHLTNVAATTCT